MTQDAISGMAAPPVWRAAPIDLLVAGAGVFGLWTAKRAIEAGLRVAVIDPRGPGAGASGGQLGALTAHAPDRWNAKKQFQFDALLELPALSAALEAETGRTIGYRRCGRVMPIRHPAYRAQVAARSAAAEAAWRRAETGLVYEARSDAAEADWLSPGEAAEGYVWDSLAARLAPRAYVGALWDWVAARANVELGVGFRGWDGAARRDDGGRLAAGAVVVAAGYESFPLMRAMLRDAASDGAPDSAIGGGVKGQSVRLRLAGAAARPLIYEDGVYVAPHDDGTVAVSGTSEKNWVDPTAINPENDAFLRRARALCPPLAGAEILDWWAGVRPRARKRDPMIGRAPIAAPIYVATGGYKISFGIAHRVAAALVEEIMGVAPATILPETFRLSHHLR